MAMWVFGYGSLVWNPGFAHDARLVGFVRDYRRVFYQGQWGVAYKISTEQDKQTALEYLEVREKQYDEKIYLDLYTDSSPKTPAVKNVMVYLATTNKESNQNYLGPAPLEEMAKYSAYLTCSIVILQLNLRQIFLAEGPTGPNKEYLFKLEDALNKIGKELLIHMSRIWQTLCASIQTLRYLPEEPHFPPLWEGKNILKEVRPIHVQLLKTS
uniref:glutathione-specific gamma-glutamylcyclotransferase n=1 Tax=Oryza punctata TaxID=4537 RepID=A0A0E0KR73_ORYPU